MTTRAYMTSRALHGQAVIHDLGQDERPWVVLDTTRFHPQGGGQRADRGWINEIPVVHVASPDGRIAHYVESTDGLAIGQHVEVSVDAPWRAQNARLHSGGHLLSALVEERFPGVKSVGGHHWPGEARVEFSGTPMPELELVQSYLDEALRDIVDLAVPYKTSAAPDGTRLIQVGMFPPVPRGGTHVETTGDLFGMLITGIKVKKGKLRISYDFNATSPS